jgi:hypothetical protein
MERVFTTDVRNQHGDVKYRAGEKRDWPKATWDGLAASLDQELDEFSASPEAAAALVAQAVSSRKKATAQAAVSASPVAAPAKAKGKVTRGTIRRA